MWAFIRPDGSILADSAFKNARHAWTVGLGWPDPEEILEAKKRGYKVCRVEISFVGEDFFGGDRSCLKD